MDCIALASFTHAHTEALELSTSSEKVPKTTNHSNNTNQNNLFLSIRVIRVIRGFTDMPSGFPTLSVSTLPPCHATVSGIHGRTATPARQCDGPDRQAANLRAKHEVANTPMGNAARQTACLGECVLALRPPEPSETQDG